MAILIGGNNLCNLHAHTTCTTEVATVCVGCGVHSHPLGGSIERRTDLHVGSRAVGMEQSG